jgi:hypothetical protein
VGSLTGICLAKRLLIRFSNLENRVNRAFPIQPLLILAGWSIGLAILSFLRISFGHLMCPWSCPSDLGAPESREPSYLTVALAVFYSFNFVGCSDLENSNSPNNAHGLLGSLQLPCRFPSWSSPSGRLGLRMCRSLPCPPSQTPSQVGNGLWCTMASLARYVRTASWASSSTPVALQAGAFQAGV